MEKSNTYRITSVSKTGTMVMAFDHDGLPGWYGEWIPGAAADKREAEATNLSTGEKFHTQRPSLFDAMDRREGGAAPLKLSYKEI